MELSTIPILTEYELVTLTEKLFVNMNFLVFKEVPIFSSSVDMILVKNDYVYAIEFKLQNWKRAIEQVKKHEISVDYMYICLPKMKKESTRKNIESKCHEEGVGLFYVNLENGKHNVEEVIRPKRPNCVWKKQKESLLNYLIGKYEMR